MTIDILQYCLRNFSKTLKFNYIMLVCCWYRSKNNVANTLYKKKKHIMTIYAMESCWTSKCNYLKII